MDPNQNCDPVCIFVTCELLRRQIPQAAAKMTTSPNNFLQDDLEMRNFEFCYAKLGGSWKMDAIIDDMIPKLLYSNLSFEENVCLFVRYSRNAANENSMNRLAVSWTHTS